MNALYKFISLSILSLAVYMLCFAFVFKKPLTIGYYFDMYKHRQTYLSGNNEKKLLIVAGSNGLYSHSAMLIEKETGIRCINYSVSAGMGIDLILEKAKEVLRQGDIVLMPLEFIFYRQAKKDIVFASMGNNYIFQYERNYLFKFGTEKALASIFSFDIKYLFSSLIEIGLLHEGFERRVHLGTLNQNGDMIGHTKDNSEIYASVIRQLPCIMPPKELLNETPYSCRIIQNFLLWCKSIGVTVYGSLPTTFDDHVHDIQIIKRIRDIYLDAGQYFIQLPNLSQYPRSCFHDTAYHLNYEFQQLHSRAIARSLSHKQVGIASKRILK